MDWRRYIHVDPKILVGKPVFRGTRIGVEMVLRDLGNGWTDRDLLEQYPTLKPEHLRAAQAYAADAISRDQMIVLDRIGS